MRRRADGIVALPGPKIKTKGFRHPRPQDDRAIGEAHAPPHRGTSATGSLGYLTDYDVQGVRTRSLRRIQSVSPSGAPRQTARLAGLVASADTEHE